MPLQSRFTATWRGTAVANTGVDHGSFQLVRRRMSTVAPSDVLRQKISSRTAQVGVVGLGYVGLPLLVEFARAGYHAVGFDIDARKVEDVNRGHSYIPDVPSEAVATQRAEGRIRATTDFSELAQIDTVNICV